MRSRPFLAALAAAIILSLLSGCRVDVRNPYDTDSDRSTVQSAPITTTTTAAPASPSTTPSLPSTTAPAVPSATTVPVTTTAETTTIAAPPITEPIQPPEPADTDLVLLSDYLPEAALDIRYATTNNFTGQVIYDAAAPRLRYGTVKKLRTVCEKLEDAGYRLVIWDAWRPAEAQWKLWNICPDPTYVSNPNNGYSSHTRGGTVDISLVRPDGTPVEMPTDFDDFSKAADLDFSDVSAEAAKNAELLQSVMTECGFKPYRAEWWHFTDTTAYEVQEALPE
ncbi:MAG: M15 family metallopeptidase [Clostridia bacterium]|nr:M15 family metallopeptidase [Clostridia bacterium]